MTYHKVGVSIFAVMAALVLTGPLEFATAQESLNSTLYTRETKTQQTPEDLMEQCIQEGNRLWGQPGECMLEARDPLLSELEADEAAADLDSGRNQVIDKLSSMNGTEAMKSLLELQVVEILKDQRAIMELRNQTVPLSATLNLTGDGWPQTLQEVIEELEARDPLLSELEADEAAADLDSGRNQVIDKLSSMNGTEAMKSLLELQLVEKLKDLKTLYMGMENQTAS
jgi:5-methylcytosine-specific restriction endonuclease McrBC GTP-binding regulatory subunit McrB